jgi:hypothetical protein
MANNVQDLDKELAELESAIAEPGLAAVDQVKLRERHAYVAARMADLERSAPYAELDLEALQAKREDGEIEREDKRLELDAAKLNRGERSPLVRRLTRELSEIDQRESGLRVELESRRMQQVNSELALHRAGVVAEREQRAEDEAAIAGLEDDWRRVKASQELEQTFADRLAKRVPATEERLWSEAEVGVGRNLLWGGPGPGPAGPVARPLSELLAEANTPTEQEAPE